MEEKTSPRLFQRMVSLVLICFFFSGVTGLIYEILWTRMMVEIIGGSPFTISIILTVFMGGLGLGSFLAGRTIDRVKEPIQLVKIYGALELTIGAFGLAIPLLLKVFRPFYALLYNQLFNYFMLYNLLTFLGCCILLCIPVICMGATLPILCRFYVTKLSHLGTHTGRLYGLNTVGAALGALLCGFWLISLLGVWGTLILAVLINCIIGLSCLRIGYKLKKQPFAEEQVASEQLQYPQADTAETGLSNTPGVLVGALIIFAVSGFCAMAYEVIWTNLLGLTIGPTTYSFTVILVTFILGLAVGSMFFGWLADKTGRVIWLLLLTQVAAGLFALATSQLLGNSQLFFAKLIFHFARYFALLNVAKAVTLFAFMILPTLCLGATFPLVGKICTQSLSRVGKSIGFAYTVNTIGAVLGSFSAGFLLMPLLGKQTGLRMVIALQLFTSLLIAAIIAGKNRRDLSKAVPLAVPALLGLLLCLRFPVWDYSLNSVGYYHRFDQAMGMENISFLRALLRGPQILTKALKGKGDLVYHADGLGGFITVTRYPNPLGDYSYALAISGKADASSHGDMRTQALLAHFPMLFHPNPKTVMVLGLASGITAGEVLCYPVEKLDILDINRQIVAASNFFIPWNDNVLSNPKTNLIIQDGRAHLQLTKQKYDVIISEPSNPWMAGLATLFTQDFFTLARNSLNDNGIFVQFMHSYQMNWPAFSMIGRTFSQVFPNSLLVVTDPSGQPIDYLLVGIKGDYKLNPENAERKTSYVQRSKNITLANPKVLCRLVVSEDLPKLFDNGLTNTDNRPLLEFVAPKLMYLNDPAIRENLASKAWLRPETKNIIQQAISDINSQIDFAAYALSVNAPFTNMVELSKAAPAQKERFFKIVESYCTKNPIDFTIFNNDALARRCREIQIARIENNIELMPDKSDSYFKLAELCHDQNEPNKAIANYLNALRLKPDNVVARINLGTVLDQQGNLDEAVKQFKEAERIHPDIPEVYRNLGIIAARKNRLDEAVGYYTRALQLRPDLAAARRELADILAKQGKSDQATAEYQKVFKASPEDPATYNSLGVALSQQRNFKGAVEYFAKALQIRPDFFPALQNFERVLVQQSSPEEVIRLAEQACELTSYKNPFLLVDLAASYSVAGRFPDATMTAEKALLLAQSLGNQKLINEIQSRLQSYKERRLYRPSVSGQSPTQKN